MSADPHDGGRRSCCLPHLVDGGLAVERDDQHAFVRLVVAVGVHVGGVVLRQAQQRLGVELLPRLQVARRAP